MRERLRRLFTRLINSRDEAEKAEILEDYKAERSKIIKESNGSDYDSINENQYRKY